MNEESMEAAQDFVDEHSRDRDNRIAELEEDKTDLLNMIEQLKHDKHKKLKHDMHKLQQELDMHTRTLEIMSSKLLEISGVLLVAAKEVDGILREVDEFTKDMKGVKKWKK
jgi:hypothetical protein